jgi:hypothetical protein
MLGAPTGRRGCLDINEIFILMLSDLDIPMSVRGARRSWGGTIMAQDEAY